MRRCFPFPQHFSEANLSLLMLLAIPWESSVLFHLLLSLIHCCLSSHQWVCSQWRGFHRTGFLSFCVCVAIADRIHACSIDWWWCQTCKSGWRLSHTGVCVVAFVAMSHTNLPEVVSVFWCVCRGSEAGKLFSKGSMFWGIRALVD